MFPVDSNSPISVVSASGGERRQVTTLGPDESSHRHPRFLPDGERFLFVVRRDSGGPELRVGSFDGTPAVPLLDTPANAEYANGRLLFVRDRTLVAQALDADGLRLSGEAVSLVDDIMVLPQAELAIFSVSRDGALAYQTGEKITQNRLTWRDAAGQELGMLGEPAEWQDPSISPDGKQVAVTLYGLVNGDVWIHDVERDLARRFTFDAAIDSSPMWFHDGEMLAFSSFRSGTFALRSAPLTGTAEPRLIVEAESRLTPLAASPASDELVFYEPRGDPAELVAIAREGGEQRPLVDLETTGASEAAISPDGRWLAFDSGRAVSEVYVTTFPTPGRRWQVRLGKWRATRNDSRASSARRTSSPRSTTLTSPRSTDSRRPTASRFSSSNW